MKRQTSFWKNKNILNILPSQNDIYFRLNFCESSCLYDICERMETGRIDRRMYEYTSVPNHLLLTFHRIGIGTLIASVSLETPLSCTCLQQPTLFLADMSSLYSGNSAGRYISSSGLSIGCVSHTFPSLYKSYIHR